MNKMVPKFAIYSALKEGIKFAWVLPLIEFPLLVARFSFFSPYRLVPHLGILVATSSLLLYLCAYVFVISAAFQKKFLGVVDFVKCLVRFTQLLIYFFIFACICTLPIVYATEVIAKRTALNLRSTELYSWIGPWFFVCFSYQICRNALAIPASVLSRERIGLVIAWAREHSAKYTLSFLVLFLILGLLVYIVRTQSLGSSVVSFIIELASAPILTFILLVLTALYRDETSIDESLAGVGEYKSVPSVVTLAFWGYFIFWGRAW